MTILTSLMLFLVWLSSSYLMVNPDHEDCLLERIALSCMALASGIGLPMYLGGQLEFNSVSFILIWAVGFQQMHRFYRVAKELYDEPIRYEDK